MISNSRLARRTHCAKGNDITLMANGVMVSRALDAADTLAQRGIHARVVNMSSMSPMDMDAVLDAARNHARHRHG